MKIGYLGPQGSFSEEASLSVTESSSLVACSSLSLRESLKTGKIQKAVLPIENSVEGPVNWVFDLLLQNKLPFLIEGEIVWPIKQNLIGFGELSDVKLVCSHPQALAQCSNFLDQLKAKTRDADSTSKAVQSLARGEVVGAAIGTIRAADIYQVPVIQKNINDNPGNMTRFIILGNKQKRRTGEDKTSFVFGTEDRSGALYRVLEVLDVLRINMTMIISRPSKKSLGEYVFFVDVDGYQKEDDLKIAFRKIEERVSFLRILGSYPRAVKK